MRTNAKSKSPSSVCDSQLNLNLNSDLSSPRSLRIMILLVDLIYNYWMNLLSEGYLNYFMDINFL